MLHNNPPSLEQPPRWRSPSPPSRCHSLTSHRSISGTLRATGSVSDAFPAREWEWD
jgi:hypothetical protein